MRFFIATGKGILPVADVDQPCWLWTTSVDIVMYGTLGGGHPERSLGCKLRSRLWPSAIIYSGYN